MKITVRCMVVFTLFGNNIYGMDSRIIKMIGEQIWYNEASKREDLLVFWNEKESFPSLGIGHNIWFPEGQEIKYTQGFPPLCNYLKDHGIDLPAWLEESLKKGAPWQNREDFYNDHAHILELRQLLVNTIGLQAQYMVDSLNQKIPILVEATPIEDREKVTRYIHLMLASPCGMYALVDYHNFKGDGLNPKEESRGERWGLLSVLRDMPDNLTEDAITRAFAFVAAKKLLMLIEHSAPTFRRMCFLGGWMKRLSTYYNSNFLG